MIKSLEENASESALYANFYLTLGLPWVSMNGRFLAKLSEKRGVVLVLSGVSR